MCNVGAEILEKAHKVSQGAKSFVSRVTSAASEKIKHVASEVHRTTTNLISRTLTIPPPPYSLDDVFAPDFKVVPRYL